MIGAHSRRYVAVEPVRSCVLCSSADIYAFLREEVATWDREQFLTVTLDNKHKVIAIDRVSVGGLTASIVLPREVFKDIVPANVAVFIWLQNHPSGDPTPSKEACLPTRSPKPKA